MPRRFTAVDARHQAPSFSIMVCAGLLTQVKLASVVATAILLAVGTVLYLLPFDKESSSSA